MSKQTQITLNALERLRLPEILPQQADMLTQMLAKDIRKKIEVTAKDRKLLAFKKSDSEQGGFIFKLKNLTKTEKTIEFTKPELHVLQSQVSALDKAEKITPELLEVCLKIQEPVLTEKDNSKGAKKDAQDKRQRNKQRNKRLRK